MTGDPNPDWPDEADLPPHRPVVDVHLPEETDVPTPEAQTTLREHAEPDWLALVTRLDEIRARHQEAAGQPQSYSERQALTATALRELVRTSPDLGLTVDHRRELEMRTSDLRWDAEQAVKRRDQIWAELQAERRDGRRRYAGMLRERSTEVLAKLRREGVLIAAEWLYPAGHGEPPDAGAGPS